MWTRHPSGPSIRMYSTAPERIGQLNRGGNLVFVTQRDGFPVVAVDKGGIVTTLASHSSSVNLLFTALPAINDKGAVAFSGTVGTPIGRPAVFKVEGNQVTTVATGADLFSAVNINNNGVVAFGRFTVRRLRLGWYLCRSRPAGRQSGRRRRCLVRIHRLQPRWPWARARPLPERPRTDRVLLHTGERPEGSCRSHAGRSEPGSAPVAGRLGGECCLSFRNRSRLRAPSFPCSVTVFRTGLVVSSTPALPTSLSNVSVTFNGIAAPLYFVSPKQINAQVPIGITGSTVQVQVRASNGQSDIRTLTGGIYSPAIYTLTQSGSGQAIVTFADTSTLAAPRGATPDSRPARAGDIVTIYANGLGPVTPAIESGVNSCGGTCAPDFSNFTLRRVTTMPVVEIGGVRVPDENILFAGLAPQFVGLYQINLRLAHRHRRPYRGTRRAAPGKRRQSGQRDHGGGIGVRLLTWVYGSRSVRIHTQGVRRPDEPRGGLHSGAPDGSAGPRATGSDCVLQSLPLPPPVSRLDGRDAAVLRSQAASGACGAIAWCSIACRAFQTSRCSADSPAPAHSPVLSSSPLAWQPASGESARSVKRIASPGKRTKVIPWDSHKRRARRSATRRSL